MVDVLLALVACAGGPPPEEAEPEPEAVEPELGRGGIPYEFPVVGTTAQAGEFVLAPSREFLDRALDEGGAAATYVWYGATMVEPGPAESTVRSLSGAQFVLPDALIVPIPKGATAAPGDVLLGHWESGSGMQRAIVVGGTPTEPVVRYLDLDLDNPSGVGTKEDAWKADRFVPLVPGGVGVTTACRRDGQVHRGVLVAFAKGRALTLEFAGHLFANAAADCMPLDPKPAVAVGDTVQVPNVGVFAEATVKRIDATIGRIFVDLGGKEVGVAQVDVAPALDRFGQGFVGGAPVADAPSEEPAPAGPAKASKGRNGRKAGKGKR